MRKKTVNKLTFHYQHGIHTHRVIKMESVRPHPQFSATHSIPRYRSPLPRCAGASLNTAPLTGEVGVIFIVNFCLHA